MRVVGTLFMAAVICMARIGYAYGLFEKIGGIEASGIRKVRVSSFDKARIYAASGRVLFRSTDAGAHWRKLFVAKDELIVDVSCDPFLYGVVYVLTQAHAYRITDTRIQRIYSAPPETEFLSIYIASGIIYIGSTRGMFRAQDDFLHWKKIRAIPEDTEIFSIDGQGAVLYALSDSGVFRSNEKKEFIKSIFLADSKEQEEEDIFISSRTVHADIFDVDTVYVGTSRGLYTSYDAGRHWQKAVYPWVNHADIRDITQFPSHKNCLYLATDKGVVMLKEKGKTELLFEGLPTGVVNSLTISPQGNLLAATDKGLYRQQQYYETRGTSELELLLKEEPSIREIQEQAMRYNEVHPEKIARWRRGLKYRALAPQLDVDYDKTITYDSGSDIYHTGPYDWGVRLSWDLGDFIWNTYEDDVDTRARLTSQLRINILDEINTVYHERLRLKQQLSLIPPGSADDRFEKKLRIKELTAVLDGYTGGFFSRRRKELQSR